MNKYLSRESARGSPMRYNKRPNYGLSSSGAWNGSVMTPSRYQHQNLSETQYFQRSHYEKGHNFNGTSSKRTNKAQSPSSYLHKSGAALSTSLCSTVTQNVLNFSANQPKTNFPTSSPTASSKNKDPQIHNQQQQVSTTVDNSSFYCNYGSFPSRNYNTDFLGAASTLTFGVENAISPLMWQTIKSTPPPKVAQQPSVSSQHLTSILPPLPSTEQLPRQFPPLPPLPSRSIPTEPSIAPSSATTDSKNDRSNDQDAGNRIFVLYVFY